MQILHSIKETDFGAATNKNWLSARCRDYRDLQTVTQGQ